MVPPTTIISALIRAAEYLPNSGRSMTEYPAQVSAAPTASRSPR